jgi:hypothetical protein
LLTAVMPLAAAVASVAWPKGIQLALGLDMSG